MRKLLLCLLLGLAGLALAAAEGQAACPSPVAVTTVAGTNTNFGVSADSAGNCSTNITDNATVGTGGAAVATPLHQCNSVATYNASTSGATIIVAASGSNKVYVCGYVFFVGTVATNVGLVYGTTAGCASGLSASGMPGSGGASFTGFPIPAGGAIVDHPPFWSGIVTPASQALCIDTSAGNLVSAIVYYDQAP